MRKYLCAFDAGLPTSINLVQALELVAVAWNDVQEQTIVNCWFHSGVSKSLDGHNNIEFEEGCDQTVLSLFNRMHALLDLPSDIAFEHYTESDSYVPTASTLTDGEIVDEIKGPMEDTSENIMEDTEPIIPSNKQILQSLHAIRLYLRTQDSAHVQQTIEQMNAVESTILDLLVNSRQQTKITDYFTEVI